MLGLIMFTITLNFKTPKDKIYEKNEIQERKR